MVSIKKIVIGGIAFTAFFAVNSLLALLLLNAVGLLDDDTLYIDNGGTVPLTAGKRYYLFQVIKGEKCPDSNVDSIVVSYANGQQMSSTEPVPRMTYSATGPKGQVSGACIGLFVAKSNGSATITVKGMLDGAMVGVKTSLWGEFLWAFSLSSLACVLAGLETFFVLRFFKRKSTGKAANDKGMNL